MRIAEHTFTVSLTEQEVDAITTALHSAYKSLDADQQPVMVERKKEYRNLRDDFGHLINRTFMGLDA